MSDAVGDLPPDGSEPAPDFGIDPLVDFSSRAGISLEDAERAFADSGPITDFLETNQGESWFGAVWVTYGDGKYAVHLRVLNAVGVEKAEALRASLRRSDLDVVVGGPSHADLTAASRLLGGLGVPHSIATDRGVLLVSPADVERAALATQLVEAVPLGAPMPFDPGLEGSDDARSGADVWRNNGSWSNVCTSAFVWQGFSSGTKYTGCVTAGHCPSPNSTQYTYSDGEYSPFYNPKVMLEVCGNGLQGDYEWVRFEVPPINESEYFIDKTTSPNSEKDFKVAGGYYQGQPTLKIGNSTNGATGSNTGYVEFYSFVNFDETTSQCNVDAWSLSYTNSSDDRDSGGPVFLRYNNAWFLGGVHRFKANPARYSTAIWDVARPAQLTDVRICHYITPCS